MSDSSKMAPPDIQVENLKKSFRGSDVLRGIDLMVDSGEFCVIVGPSGCGKSTLLKSIVGQFDPDQGHILLNGENITDVPVNERDMGFVFQEFEETLFPHMTVSENVAFGLRQNDQEYSKTDIERQVNEMLDLLAISETRDTKPGELSGGQQQRVELARQLIREVGIMLLDDPLADLDYKLQKEMELEMRRIHTETQGTYIYVTHDQDQALKLADKLVVMNQGIIEQVGTPQEIYTSPTNAFVGRFIGDTNLLEGTVVDRSDTEMVTVETVIGPLSVCEGDDGLELGADGIVLIRPEDIVVGSEAAAVDNQFESCFEDRTYTGEATEFVFSIETDAGKETVQTLHPGNVTLSETNERDQLSIGWSVSDAVCFSQLNGSGNKMESIQNLELS